MSCKGYILIGDKRILIGDINTNVNNGKDYTYSNMNNWYTKQISKQPRFKPLWQDIGEYFSIGDYRGTPKRIDSNKDRLRFSYDDTRKVDLKLCEDVCELLNQLDKSYLNLITELVNRAEYWETIYKKVNKRNQKLEKIIIEKEISEV